MNIIEALRFLEQEGVIRRYVKTVRIDRFAIDRVKPGVYKSIIDSYKCDMIDNISNELVADGIITKNHIVDNASMTDLVLIELVVVVPPVPRVSRSRL
jgi:hypothetical protein